MARLVTFERKQGKGKVGVNMDLITQAYEVDETTTRIGFAGEAINFIEVSGPLDTVLTKIEGKLAQGSRGQRRPAHVIVAPPCPCRFRCDA
jgi:hypothetical protein